MANQSDKVEAINTDRREEIPKTVENHDLFRVPFFVFWGCGITRRCSWTTDFTTCQNHPWFLDDGWVDDSRDCDFTLRYGRNGQAYGFLYQQAVDVLLKINMTSWDFHLVQVAKNTNKIIVLFSFTARRFFRLQQRGKLEFSSEFQGEIWQSQWCESMAWKIFFLPQWFCQNFSIQYWLNSRKKALTRFFLRQFLLRALRQCLVAAGAPADLVQLAPGYADAGKALVEHSDKAERENREFLGENLLFFG